MGMNDFASHLNPTGKFIVKNISLEKKTIKIFDFPILHGTTRDILQIRGVGEGDIRASLLKGELNYKLKAKDIIIIYSNIDLLQFNYDQKLFLQNHGLYSCMDIGTSNVNQELYDYFSSDGQGISSSEHERIRQLIHFIDEGPGDGFTSGAYKEVIGQPFPTSITWYTDVSKASKIIEKLIIRDSQNQNPLNISWNMYDIDGTTIIHNVTDTITYENNSFESTRTRTIS